jgi:CRISPR-associated protein Cmr3
MTHNFVEQSLSIIPLDSLLFRDGKPFDMTIHFARSIFPPFPYSFAGLLRTHFGRALNFDEQKMKEAGLGYGDDFGEFYLDGAYIQKDDELYFPVPADLLHEKDKDEVIGIISPSLSTEETDIKSSFPKSFAKLKANPDKEGQPFSIGFISQEDMSNYLLGDTKNIKIEKLEFFADKEERTSVQINENAASQDGKLFTAQLLRFTKDSGFALSFKGPDFGDKDAFGTFGGEKRGVKIIKRQALKLPKINSIPNKIKLVLTTPAFFENMQTPKNLDGLRLVSAVSLGYENIGGWDLAKHCPKPMRKAIKAGSVYYYEAQNLQQAIETLQKTISISDFDAQAGMGKFLIGGWANGTSIGFYSDDK